MYLSSHQFSTGQMSKRLNHFLTARLGGVLYVIVPAASLKASCCISTVATYQYTSSCMRPLTVKHADIPIKRRNMDPDTFGLDPFTQCPAATVLPIHASKVPSPRLHTSVHMSVGNACAFAVVTCVTCNSSLRRQNRLGPGVHSIDDCTDQLVTPYACCAQLDIFLMHEAALQTLDLHR